MVKVLLSSEEIREGALIDHSSSSGPSVVPRKALICFWEGYLGVAPSLINLAICLAEEGFVVDILLLNPWEPFASAPEIPGVRVIALDPVGRGEVWSTLPRPVRALALPGMAADLWRMQRAARQLARDGYDVIFGIDMFGLQIARSALEVSPEAKLIYWSLELIRLGELRNPVMRHVKKQEARLASSADLIVCQDPGRSAVLFADLGLCEPRHSHVPNAPIGTSTVHGSTFLHDRLGLPRTMSLLVHAGMICEAADSLAMAAAAADLPDDWRLVFHERQTRSDDEPYLKEVVAAGKGKVVLSLDPVALDEVELIFGSAKVGLVSYSDKFGENFSEIAFASGKLGYFLRAGIPVIVNDLPSLRTFVRQNECGGVLEAGMSLRNLIAEVEERYDALSAAAVDSFRRELDFRRHFEGAIRLMRE